MAKSFDLKNVFQLNALLGTIKATLSAINEKHVLDAADVDAINEILGRDRRNVFVSYYKARKGLVPAGQIHPDVLVAKAALSLARVTVASHIVQALNSEVGIKVQEASVSELSERISVAVKDQFLRPDELAYFNNSQAYAYTTDPVKSLVGRFREFFYAFLPEEESGAPNEERLGYIGSRAQALVDDSAAHHNL